MPSAISPSPSSSPQTPTPNTSPNTSPTPRITKFTNCLIPLNNQLVPRDIWVDSSTGKILDPQQAFYEHKLSPDQTLDLGGRILAPGFIDVQLNGAIGFDFSEPRDTKEEYDAGLRDVNRALIRTGVTSYLPTVTSQRAEVYPKVLPSLGPSGAPRDPSHGAESLGAHVEGPFLSPGKNGIHKKSVLRTAHTGLQDLIDVYGASNIPPETPDTPPPQSPTIKLLTAAPELGTMQSLIPALSARGIAYSIGHSDATYEQALSALSAGARMITHLFNAMRPFAHRHPGIFGLLGQSELPDCPRPYYGLIADGIHLHPTSVQIAFNAHPDGMVLVTDAMKLCGMPDGEYAWTNGERIVKRGALLTLVGGEGEGRIAGSSATLVQCVNNFRRWAGARTVAAIKAVTETPARMLGVEGVKGVVRVGADADLVVLEDVVVEGEGEGEGGGRELRVEQVWKFGVRVY
ncbi:hypothetical protein FQN51_005179 [Onygenales sp. PD_10]|nr:hypothetical protein FQN51_005179 [Onygenales sp. PD_10]